jgi:hypothetical protein
VTSPADVKEPVLLRAGLGSRFVRMETGGVGRDDAADSSFSTDTGTGTDFVGWESISKSEGMEHGVSRSARSSSSKESWSLLRERGEASTSIMTRRSLFLSSESHSILSIDQFKKRMNKF